MIPVSFQLSRCSDTFLALYQTLTLGCQAPVWSAPCLSVIRAAKWRLRTWVQERFGMPGNGKKFATPQQIVCCAREKMLHQRRAQSQRRLCPAELTSPAFPACRLAAAIAKHLIYDQRSSGTSYHALLNLLNLRPHTYPRAWLWLCSSRYHRSGAAFRWP